MRLCLPGFKYLIKILTTTLILEKRKVVEKERDVVEEKLLEIIGGSTADKPPDELDLFFNTIKEKVRKLPEDMQEDIQDEMFALVGRYVRNARAAANNNNNVMMNTTNQQYQNYYPQQQQQSVNSVSPYQGFFPRQFHNM